MGNWYENPLVWIGIVTVIVGIVSTAVIAITLLIKIFKSLIGIGEWKGGVNVKIKDFEKYIEKVDNFMDEMRKKFDDILERTRATTVQNASPKKLTELGQSVSEIIDASNWAEERANELTDEVAGMSAYDIQSHAFQYAKKYRYEEDMDARIKQCAFEKGIDRDDVIDVLGIKLRDRLLSLHRLPVPE